MYTGDKKNISAKKFLKNYNHSACCYLRNFKGNPKICFVNFHHGLMPSVFKFNYYLILKKCVLQQKKAKTKNRQKMWNYFSAVSKNILLYGQTE